MHRITPFTSSACHCAAALLWVLTGACAGDSDAKEDSCTAQCEPGPDLDDGRWGACADNVVERGPDDSTVVGVTGAQVLATLEGERTGVLRWTRDAEGGGCGPDGGSAQPNELVTEVTIDVTAVGEVVRQIESSPRYSGPSLPPACAAPRLELDVELRMVTADGAFDEVWSAVAIAHSSSPPPPGLFYVTTPDGASLDACDDHVVLIELAVDPVALGGSYDARSLYDDFPADFDPIVTTLRLLFCGDGVVGDSALFAERIMGMAVEAVGGPGLQLQAGRSGCIGL